MKAYSYQESGIDFLYQRQKACLWDEPGLGKSFQALSAMKRLDIKNTIIVCPASVRMVWKSECEKVNLDSHTVTQPKHIREGINIISYEGVTKCFPEISNLRKDLIAAGEDVTWLE